MENDYSCKNKGRGGFFFWNILGGPWHWVLGVLSVGGGGGVGCKRTH